MHTKKKKKRLQLTITASTDTVQTHYSGRSKYMAL
jgi:hypothetical protein